MDKYKLIKYLGGTCEIACQKLGYAHRNSMQRLSNPLTDLQAFKIMQRMKKNNIPIPEEMKLL